jgi:hypothetical protein
VGTIELRKLLAEQLYLIEDKSFLEALKTIIDSKVASTSYELSNFQKERIISAENQFKKGETISDDLVHSKIEKWLKSK